MYCNTLQATRRFLVNVTVAQRCGAAGLSMSMATAAECHAGDLRNNQESVQTIFDVLHR